MIDDNSNKHINPSALSECPEIINSYSQVLKWFIGLSAAMPGVLLTCLRVSSFLKINNKNGLSNPRETREKSADNILNEKYAVINLGYLATYLKMVRKLFIPFVCSI